MTNGRNEYGWREQGGAARGSTRLESFANRERAGRQRHKNRASGFTVQRRSEEERPSVRQGVERKAAVVIISSVLLCIAIVVGAIWSAGQMALSPAEQAMAEIALTRSQKEVQGGEEWEAGQSVLPSGSFDGYQQLSDPLLVLVNDDVPIPDDWQVTPAFVDDETVDNRIYQDLSAMMEAAERENVWFWVASGYRSVEDQERILSREIEGHMRDDNMSEEEARELSLRTIARPGYSEHHTGLAIDLNDVSDNFEETVAYQWLCQHGAEYGFVQRYRSDKVGITGIDNESWHYRYVGPEHAKKMNELNMCLEEYVLYLKDQGVT